MGLKSAILNLLGATDNSVTINDNTHIDSDVNAFMVNFGGRSILFDGEKTPNELGTAYEFFLDYQRIRMRSWEAYIKSTVIQTAIKQYCLWIVGHGLKFQAEPDIDFLKTKGIAVDEKWKNKIESQFRLYANDKKSSYSKECNLHILAAECLKNAILSGDVLVILRYKSNGQPTVQIIDGGFIQTPYDYYTSGNANKIVDGVEISSTGQHVAYHVLQDDGSFARVLANPSGKIGTRQAWLMYGIRHKINDTRGMSLLTAVLERDSKLDRFLEASVGAAEENSKIPFTFEHSQYSDGTNPIDNQMAQSLGVKKPVKNETALLDGYATKIAATTGKQAYNLPVGATLKKHTDNSDPNFASFYTPNAELIYATIGIPPEVAIGKYGGTYSGSRASNKAWEFKMKVERENTLTQYFYKPIYDFFFIINMYKGNIQADGFRDALYSDDWMTISAYTRCRFIGQSVPHIDPVKEATAQRIWLGDAYDNIPLKTGEQSCEEGNTGDFQEVQKLATQELDGNPFRIVENTNQSVVKKATKAEIKSQIEKSFENND